MNANERKNTDIYSLLTNIFHEENIVHMVLSAKRKKSQNIQKALLRSVLIKGEKVYQIEYFENNQAFHKNMNKEDSIKYVYKLMNDCFKQINIFTETADIQILANKIDKPKIIRKLPSKGMPSLNLEHNRVKNRIIPDNIPCDFLISLGVSSPDGKVYKKHYNKFRQINRFLEIVDDVFPLLEKEKEIKIVDFGCGKAYLTFALYYYLNCVKGKKVIITGLDLKDSVVRFCNKIAKELKYDGLDFKLGDIANFNEHAHMVVTLHACDTATDYALINAVNRRSNVILSVPCCQHELFSQMSNSLHEPILKYGILKDRFTEYLTDALRGLKLEANGYDVSMIEFTTLEHTSKNIMIKAIKTRTSNSKTSIKAQEEFNALCEFYNVNPTINKI